MPKALQNEICRADAKKCSSSLLANCKRPLFSKVAKKLIDKATKKKSFAFDTTKTTTTRLTKSIVVDNETEKKLKPIRKNAKHGIPIKTRSGTNAENKLTTNAVKMKEKLKNTSTEYKTKSKEDKTSRIKQREIANLKKVANTSMSSTVYKKETKKSKNDTGKNATSSEKNEIMKNELETVSLLPQSTSPAAVISKKESKRRGNKDQGPIIDLKKVPKSSKKMEEVAIGTDLNCKKEYQKNISGISEENVQKKDTKQVIKSEDSKMDERCMAPKKRIKHKCARESMVLDVKKESVEEKEIPVDLSMTSVPVLNHDNKKSQHLVKNIKFFKTKSKKSEKSKELLTAGPKGKDCDTKEAFAVYDNINEDSEECNRNVKRKTSAAMLTTKKAEKMIKEAEIKPKQHLNVLKKSKIKTKVKSNDEKTEKRKLDSDIETERNVKCKKLKRNVVQDEHNNNNDDGNNVDETESLIKRSKPVKQNKKTLPPKINELKVIKIEDGSLSSSSLSSHLSDNAPLNKLASKKIGSAKILVKKETQFEDSELDSKNKSKMKSSTKKTKSKLAKSTNIGKLNKNVIKVQQKDESKSSPSSNISIMKKTTTSKKSVRFNKQTTTKVIAKPARKRRQRMASLNALAMVHCMYENESKSVSVSSFDSTENSDDNMVVATSVKRTITAAPIPTLAIISDTKQPELKEELKETAVIKFESQSENVDPVINRESLRTAPGLRSIGKHWDMNSSSISSTLSDDNEAVSIAGPPINTPIVIKDIVAIEKPKNALKKKFSRAFHYRVSEDSSEEDKHQALLLEEKQRKVRRRRRSKKENTMALKDMVVCKRMASLNATAILAASYSSTTGKRTITVKSAGKSSEEKRENVEKFEKTESLITKIKGRKLPFIRKKFSSSSDADVEDEADISGNEVVVKTASSSGKQQVSLIVNQDSGVTITGLYLNSTTKSTHHQGYCSISGMQYRISSTSHTQTEATTVTSEAIVRTPQEPLRPPITVSLHPDRQLSPSHNLTLSTNHASPVKTYTPLGALSSMQPPGSPHHMHHLHHHPKAVTISSTQEISSLERHGCPSAFSAPTVYGPPPPPPPPPPSSLSAVSARPQYPILSKTPPETGFVAGYYQPAGPLISHHHHHHHHHHHVQTNPTTATSTASAATAAVTSTSSAASSISFSKVVQSPSMQPPTPPASNITQPISETSDNEMASATTPAAEISVSENTPEEPNYPMNYHFSSSTNPPPFRSPSHTYQSYYPSPPSTASLSHPQQQAHFQEILYSSNNPAGPPGPYHLSYLQPKGSPYHTPLQRRYIPALPPQQYFHPEYAPPVSVSQQQVVVPAHPLAPTSDSYHSAPPTPSIIESYPPPPPLYYSGYSSAPPAPYYPYAASSRSLTLIETSCPCPLQGCQKNVDTGPLTGFVSKGPVEQRNTPMSPVALSLPKEPQDIRSLPSPARGSAGSRPTPSPAIATARNPSSWNEGSDCGYDTAGLLTISKGAAQDSGGDLDSGIDGTDIIDLKTTRKYDRREMKKRKIRRIKICKQRTEECCKKNGVDNFTEVSPSFYDEISGTADCVSMINTGSVMGLVPRLKPALEVCENLQICENHEEQIDELVSKKRQNCKRWCQVEEDECHSDDREMPKLYPEVGIEYENRRLNSDFINEEPPRKKSKIEIHDKDNSSNSDVISGLIDVEKNNYLSALQLCSVNDLEYRCESKICNETVNTIADNLAPLGRHKETNIKISSKCNNETHSDLPSPTHVQTETPIDTTTITKSDECVTNYIPARCCRTINTETKRPRFRRRRWTTKKKNKKKSNKSNKGNEEEKIEAEKAEKRRRAELLSLSQKRAATRLKWSNGWMWLGEPFVSKVFLNTEGPEVLRTCYHAMKHQGGDIIRPKDCILLKSGSKKTDLPYIAKVAHLWEDPEDGEMMMSLFWYYRPEHTEHDAINSESPYELYASKHKDVNSVACIEDKCYVLTFNEYCRYHKSIRQTEESVDISSVIVPPLAKKRYPRQALLPPENTPLDLVYFCRKIYDFRQHRLLKNPFFV